MSCCVSRTELHSQVVACASMDGRAQSSAQTFQRLLALPGNSVVAVCGFKNIDPELQSSIVPLDIPDQVVAQFLFVSFAKQLRDRGLVPLGIVQ